MDDTFTARDDEDELRLNVLAVIELTLAELAALDILPVQERAALSRLTAFMAEHCAPESFVGACRKRDRLIALSAGLRWLVSCKQVPDEVRHGDGVRHREAVGGIGPGEPGESIPAADAGADAVELGLRGATGDG